MKNSIFILAILLAFYSCSSNEGDVLQTKKYKNKYLYEIQIENFHDLNTYSSLDDENLNLEIRDSICSELPIYVKLLEINDIPVDLENISIRNTEIGFVQAKRTKINKILHLDWPIYSENSSIGRRIYGEYFCYVEMISFKISFGSNQFAESMVGEYSGFNPHINHLDYSKSQYGYYSMNNDGSGHLEISTAIVHPVYWCLDKYREAVFKSEKYFPHKSISNLKLYYVKYDF